MTLKKRRRLAFAVTLIAAGAVGAALSIAALRDNIRYFYSPSDIVAKRVQPGIAFRIGGLVAQNSVHKDAGSDVRFAVTDGTHTVQANFHGVLPGLFREGQGVVAFGALNNDGVFNATEVLAKHDERYVPPEVVDALKRSGHWKEGNEQPIVSANRL